MFTRRYIIIIRPLNLKRIQSIHTTILGVVASALIGVASFLAVCLMPKEMLCSMTDISRCEVADSV